MKKTMIVLAALLSMSTAAFAEWKSAPIEIVKPVNNETVNRRVDVVVRPINGSVFQRVDFYLDEANSQPVASIYQAPYRFNLNSMRMTEGSHILSAKAVDANGDSFSTRVAFYVGTSSGAPSCQDAVLLLRNQFDQNVSGLIAGTQGGELVEFANILPGDVAYYHLTTVPKDTGVFDFNITANAVSTSGMPLQVECTASIPNVNGCPFKGTKAVITFDEPRRGGDSLRCRIDVR